MSTEGQIALGDCDPLWADWQELCDRDAEALPDEFDPRWRDLRHQGLSPMRIARITDVHLVGDYL
jgi:hypothetical protein